MKRVVLSVLIVCGVLAVWWLFATNRSDPDCTVYGNVDVRNVDVSALVPGRIEYMAFEEGAFVSKGTLLVRLEQGMYTEQVQEMRGLVAAQEAGFHHAQSVAARRSILLEAGAISPEEYESVASQCAVCGSELDRARALLALAERRVRDTEVYAPSDGIIMVRVREPGTVVQAGEPIYVLSLTQPKWIRAYIPETMLGLVQHGMKASVMTDSSDRSYEGHIGFISPKAEFTPKSVETTDIRTSLVYRIRVVVPDPDGFLKQGMPVTVKIHIDDVGQPHE